MQESGLIRTITGVAIFAANAANFLKNYPFLHSHSVRVTYVSGEKRVPATIHDAATKLVAAEVIRHDDNSILIAETGSNIDLKTKHDILLEEANKILNGKKDVIHFID